VQLFLTKMRRSQYPFGSDEQEIRINQTVQ
jgi:hypothetical protein